jgi:hypothetical protein
MKIRFNRKFNLAILLSVLLALIIVLVFLACRKNVIESYEPRVASDLVGNYANSSSYDESAKRAGIKAANEIGDVATTNLNKAGDSIESGLDSVLAFINTEKVVNVPQWRDVYDTSAGPDTISMGIKPDTSLILTDGCTRKSILRSDYEEDICTKYQGDYQKIDEKCKALNNENCTLPVCCVLLNGNKCVAGNVNGPTFLTDQGNQIDYYYYLYGKKCYGAGCNDASNNYQAKCGAYANNSTGVSKDCMIQLFNDAGCSSTKPIYVINDEYVYNNSKTSKKYIQNDLKETAKAFLSEIAKGDKDSKVKCSADPNNPCDVYLNDSVGISKACMIRMYNDAGCPNNKPPLISSQFVAESQEKDKSALQKIISDRATFIKNSANTNASDIPICYGAGVTTIP